MNNRNFVLILLILIIGLSACNDTTAPQSSLKSFSSTPASIESSVQEEKVAESSIFDEWGSTGENTLRYLDWQGETNGVLERWLEAYRRSEYSQIYIDDPRDGLFQSWRLTCDGSDEYLIERRYAGADMPVELCGYSQFVTEGVIYYTFGEDLTEIDWLPMTIHKGLSEWTAIEENDALWVQQASISEEQAIELAAEVFGYDDYNGTYQIDERIVYLGQCYYMLKLFIGEDSHLGGHVAVSADGSVFWELNEGWHLINDTAAVQIPHSLD